MREVSWTAIHGPRATVFAGFGYSGWQPVWVREEIDLSELSGKDVQLRFFLTSDGSYNDDGWYVDDITIRSYTGAGAAYARYARIVRQGRDTVRISARIENPLRTTSMCWGMLRNDVGAILMTVFRSRMTACTVTAWRATVCGVAHAFPPRRGCFT